MKYSGERIYRAGKNLINDTIDIFTSAESIAIIDDWRRLHMPVMKEIMLDVSKCLADAGIPVAFSSQRLKRMVSIIDKLKRNETMRLDRIQDIGGVRFVFEDMETLLRARDCISNASFPGFKLEHAPYDYITSPKESGYRSIHYVFSNS